MKTVALFAALLAVSTTPAFSICKHHVSALASVSDFNVLSLSTSVMADGTEIRKCIPNCGG
jgi:hypothetical protein